MSQRNPMNERYTTEGPKGQTRKSAASAKPKTKAASSVYVESNKKAPAKKGLFGSAQSKAAAQTKAKQPAPKAAPANVAVNTPEYKKWRRAWWILIVLAIVFTGISFALQQMTGNVTITYVVLGLGYAALIAAIVVEFTKVRKARNNAAAAVANDKSKAAKRARKELEAEAARKQEEQEAAKAAKEAKKAQRGGLFSKKSDASDEKSEATDKATDTTDKAE